MSIAEYRMVYNKNMECALEKIRNYECSVNKIDDYDDAFTLLDETVKLPWLSEEYQYVIGLDCKCNIKGLIQLSHGTSLETSCRNKELFTFLLLVGADQFIIAHNHTHGDSNPSNNDILLTAKVKTASIIMDVKFLDHLIIVRNGYYMIEEDRRFYV